MVEEWGYTQEEQAEALNAGESLANESFFRHILEKQQKIWRVAVKEAGFTEEELAAYAFHHALIKAIDELRARNSDHDDELASQLSVLAWMYYWTDISPAFGSAVGKIAGYMAS